MDPKTIVRLLLDWFWGNARPLPWRGTRDPYAIWVSEIMLQQTQVKTVIPYWERWMLALPTVEAVAKARLGTLNKLWEGLGYYTRVRNMQKAARRIVAANQGKFPREFEEVLALPGIGRYTAGAICSIAYDQPRPILDGNVMRVLTRVQGISGDPRETRVNTKLWALADTLVKEADSLRTGSATRIVLTIPVAPWPNGRTRHGLGASAGTIPFCSHLNQALMELGALICAPKQPRCDICPLARACRARRQGHVDKIPNLAKRVATTARHVLSFVAHNRGRFLVRQRPAGVVNAHLWEFPNVERNSKERDLHRAARAALGFSPENLVPLCTIKHSITRYRITLEVFLASMSPRRNVRSIAGQWVSLPQARRLPFASAHRQILDRLSLRRRLAAPQPLGVGGSVSAACQTRKKKRG